MTRLSALFLSAPIYLCVPFAQAQSSDESHSQGESQASVGIHPELDSALSQPWYRHWRPAQDEPFRYSQRGLVLAPHDARITLKWEHSMMAMLLRDTMIAVEQRATVLQGAWSPMNHLEVGLGLFSGGRGLADGKLRFMDHVYARYRFLEAPIEGVAEVHYDIIEQRISLSSPFRYHLGAFVAVTVEPMLKLSGGDQPHAFAIQAEIAGNIAPGFYLSLRPQGMIHLSDALKTWGGDFALGGTLGGAQPWFDVEVSLGLAVHHGHELTNYSGASGRVGFLGRIFL